MNSSSPSQMCPCNIPVRCQYQCGHGLLESREIPVRQPDQTLFRCFLHHRSLRHPSTYKSELAHESESLGASAHQNQGDTAQHVRNEEGVWRGAKGVRGVLETNGEIPTSRSSNSE